VKHTTIVDQTPIGGFHPPDKAEPDVAPALVHEGWRHLQLQRPLAAWASWQRALRIEPGDRAARAALDSLAAAEVLPAAARASYRFRTPRGDVGRARWDARLRGPGLDDVAGAAATFAALADEDPRDAPARYNQALCLAWLGRNAEAVAALERAVLQDAADHADAAEAAWTLAEVLRQGAGAEAIADDLSYRWTIPTDRVDELLAHVARTAPLQPLPAPLDPASGRPLFPDARVFEWLDRPMPATSPPPTLADLPLVQATVVATPGAIRFSSPDPDELDRAPGVLLRDLGLDPDACTKEATPLPLRLMDAAAWTFRLPRGLDDQDRHRLTREAVERYFEEQWILRPRHGLRAPDRPGAPRLSPQGAARLAAEGDLVLRAKLSAVIRLREQLGARPATAHLYAGYPFDLLRRSLGLDPIDPMLSAGP
jgi:tetratricopeptide (TPR) repeat protein